MKTKALLFMCLCANVATGMSSIKLSNNYPDKEKVIATTQKKGSDRVVVCDFSKMNDTISLPLSYLAEEMQIVKLDNRDEALVGGRGRTTVTDSYILVSNKKQTPFRLFDRKGKFITNIGTYGQGPNEYQNTYDEQLDEKHNRIYILPWMTRKILVFDLQGNAYNPIPLPWNVPKGQFRVNTADSLVTVTTLPFEGMPSVVWVQDFKGKVKQSVSTHHFKVPRDFSNEVMATRNTDAYDVMLLVATPTRKDTLYHYNQKENRLIPRFTTTYPEDKVPIHSYMELPGCYLGSVQSPVKVSEYITVGSKPTWYIVDKKTMKGNYLHLMNDFLGSTSPESWPAIRNGYYVMNIEPLELKEKLEKAIASPKLSKEKKKELIKLSESLDENGNNVVLFAKLKK
ncbi:6-bladed beta-propeller [Bacteroides sp. 224]|uniref:6-bladed beta-propeller n=1 Tax=Bacteroides sp. 224 TaxID=2302936 RepID=UPI0013D0207B|nr:6-bladed beta-propeller [Bacteroides sp. 224]NDV67153.1 6-bladed beta-propeller [Bacteroides sp. 224]